MPLTPPMMDLLDGLLPCCRRGPRSSRNRPSRFGQLLYERRRFEPKLPRGKHPEHARKTYRKYCRTVTAMRTIAKPIVAMVDGYAVGGGFALMLARSDLVCVSETATVIPAFCQIGIAPEMGVVKFFCPNWLACSAKEILFLGDRIFWRATGRARHCGTAWFRRNSLEETTMELARRLAEMPDASIQVAKGMLNSLSDTNLQASARAGADGFPVLHHDDEAYAKTMEKFAR